MKTTIEISDVLFQQAKINAQECGVTLRALIEEGLQRILHDRKQASAQKYIMKDASVGSKTQVGVLPPADTWRELANER